MSNEATISQRTRDILKEKGFFVLKFNDSSSSGIPDMQASKDGRTTWVEDKYVSVQIGTLGKDNDKILDTGVTLSARDFISPDRMVQMVTMCKLMKTAFLAHYWLYVECGGKHYVAILSPRKVFESYRDESEMKFKVMRVGEWVNLFNSLVSSSTENLQTELLERLQNIFQPAELITPNP